MQGDILDAMWKLLKPGGTLVYATCSILPEENSKQVEAFLSRTSDAVHDALDVPYGQPGVFGRQLLPQINGHDGFFYARLRKQL